jgi:hypothetical protein
MTGIAEFYVVALFTPSHELQIDLECWISATTELSQFINLSNDLFSLPKELFSGEKSGNFPLQTRIKHYARKPSRFQTPDSLWSVRDTIYDLLIDLINATHTIDQLLLTFSDKVQDVKSATEVLMIESPVPPIDGQKHGELMVKSEKAAQLWRGFRQGFIGSHIEIARYGLDALRATQRDAGVARPKGAAQA